MATAGLIYCAVARGAVRLIVVVPEMLSGMALADAAVECKVPGPELVLDELSCLGIYVCLGVLVFVTTANDFIYM